MSPKKSDTVLYAADAQGATMTATAPVVSIVPKAVSPDSKTSNFPVKTVEVIIGYQGDNSIHEVVHVVNGDNVQIASCSHSVSKKMRFCKDDDGNIVGPEPTGEEELILRVKYFRG